MQLTVTAPQHVKDKEVVEKDSLLVELKAKKAEEIPAWVEAKTSTNDDVLKLLKSLSLAVSQLLKR